jgi:Ca2+-binding EF-hand superfamily protein
MQKVNCKEPTSKLKDKFGKYDKCNTGDIGFDDFCSLIQVRQENGVQTRGQC